MSKTIVFIDVITNSMFEKQKTHGSLFTIISWPRWPMSSNFHRFVWSCIMVDHTKHDNLCDYFCQYQHKLSREQGPWTFYKLTLIIIYFYNTLTNLNLKCSDTSLYSVSIPIVVLEHNVFGTGWRKIQQPPFKFHNATVL